MRSKRHPEHPTPAKTPSEIDPKVKMAQDCDATDAEECESCRAKKSGHCVGKGAVPEPSARKIVKIVVHFDDGSTQNLIPDP